MTRRHLLSHAVHRGSRRPNHLVRRPSHHALVLAAGASGRLQEDCRQAVQDRQPVHHVLTAADGACCFRGDHQQAGPRDYLTRRVHRCRVHLHATRCQGRMTRGRPNRLSPFVVCFPVLRACSWPCPTMLLGTVDSIASPLCTYTKASVRVPRLPIRSIRRRAIRTPHYTIPASTNSLILRHRVRIRRLCWCMSCRSTWCGRCAGRNVPLRDTGADLDVVILAGARALGGQKG